MTTPLTLDEAAEYYVNNAQRLPGLQLALSACDHVDTAVHSNSNFVNAFVFAGYNGDDDIVRGFVRLGMNVNIKDDDGETCLTCAAYTGRKDVVLLLLNQGADITIRDRSGDTPLLCAVRSGHAATVQLLLDHGANIEDVNDFGETAFTLANTEQIKDILNNHNTSSYILK